MTTNFFSPLFCFCFGIRDGYKSGSGIRIPDSPHWEETLIRK